MAPDTAREGLEGGRGSPRIRHRVPILIGLTPSAGASRSGATTVSRPSGTESLLRFHIAQLNADFIGRGHDQYHHEPLEHPAATAFYARGLARLAGATGKAEDARLAFLTGRRLIELTTGGDLPAWGLGFDWKELREGSPDTFTTAVSVLALAELNDLDPEHKFAVSELHGAARWLIDGVPWREGSTGAGPLYAPGWDYLATNVVSLTAAALFRAHTLLGDRRFAERGEEALRFVLAAQDDLGFWPYADPEGETRAEKQGARVVDSVHSAYTIEGVLAGLSRWELGDLDPDELRRAAARGIGFLTAELIDERGWVRERVLILDENDPTIDRLLNPGTKEHPLPGGRILVRMPEEARLQSYGACLALFARATHLGLPTEHTSSLVLEYVLAGPAAVPTGRFPYHPDHPRLFPRHESQLFDGLAAILATGHPIQRNSSPPPRLPLGRGRPPLSRERPAMPVVLRDPAGDAVAAVVRVLAPPGLRPGAWSPSPDDQTAALCLFAELARGLRGPAQAAATATSSSLARTILDRHDYGAGPNLIAAWIPEHASEALSAGKRAAALSDDYGQAVRLLAVMGKPDHSDERQWWQRWLSRDREDYGDAPGWRAFALVESGCEAAELIAALAAGARDLPERELAASACAAEGAEREELLDELLRRAAMGEIGAWGAWALTRLGASLRPVARVLSSGGSRARSAR